MKRIHRLLVLGLVGLCLGSLQAADPVAELLQKGLMQEEAQRDVVAAIQTYQEVLQRIDAQRQLAATAVFRLAESYRKLERTNDAVQMYQRLIRDYPGESALANLSRQNLSVLGAAGVADGGGTSAGAATRPQLLLTDEETREANRLRILLERSPDLLDAVMPGASNKMTALQNAAVHGWTQVVDFLIKTKAIRDAGGESGYPPIHLAAFYGHKAVAEQLIQAGASPNLVTREGLTPLHLAAFAGRRKIVEWLLQKGADPDRRLMGSPDLSALDMRVHIGGGVTALGLAVINGHEEVVELLLKAKADPNVGVPHYNLPIQQAVGIGVEGIIEKLFRSGVDPKAVYSVSLYATAMQALTSGNDAAIAKRLRFLKSFSVPLSAEEGGKLLEKCFSSYAVETTGALLELGADANTSLGGVPALASLVVRDKPSGRKPESEAQPLDAMVALLLKAGGDPNRVSVDGLTPLWYATERKRLGVVSQLVAKGADVNRAFPNGEPPLCFLVFNGFDSDWIGLFLQNGAKPNVRSAALGETPLECLSRRLSDQLSRPDVSAGGGVISQIAQIRELLLKHGATDDFPDFSSIRATRNDPKQRVKLFARGEGWNEFTLHEALNVLYGRLDAPTPRQFYRTVSLSGRPLLGALPPMQGNLATIYRNGAGGFSWPRWEAISIHRYDTNGTMQTLLVGMTNQLLKWGDVIEVPEADHAISAAWGGLSSEEAQNLSGTLGRTVRMSISGVTTNLQLPFLQRNQMGAINSFALERIIAGTQLPRKSSDLARVKVQRAAANGRPAQNWVFNLVTAAPDHPDLWLRDGDVVVIDDLAGEAR